MNPAAFLKTSKEKHFICLFHIKHHFFLPHNTWLFRIYFPTFVLDLLCTHSAISLVFVLFRELQHVLIVANYFLGLTATSPHTSPSYINQKICLFLFFIFHSVIGLDLIDDTKKTEASNLTSF